ncbi:MAG: GSCFA domain-containing protein, partial [Muribaculaceae bacterium]|nr:GSCFA domain-containing protein [Muribaculaceae bacterium]
MKFRTVFQPTPSAVKLSINRPILFCGSCFSDYICSRLKRSLWSGENMGGTLFNPISISYAIKILLLEDNEAQLLRMIKDSLIQHDGVWHSLLFDSSCSDTDKNKVIEKILLRRRKAQSLLEYNADMIITFGTAWTYAMIEAGTAMEGKIVGNCHKLPAHLFERRLLDPSEIIEEWYEVISELKARRPDMHFIFT